MTAEDRRPVGGREIVPVSPTPARAPLVLEAATKEQFATMLLPRIAEHSGLKPAQIAAYSGLGRSTAYNYADPDYTRFPQQVDKVRQFCKGCRLDPEQIAQVESIWHSLYGTMVVERNGEQMVEAELVDPETVHTSTTAHSRPTSANSGVAGTATGNNVIIGGMVRGNVNVNTVNHFVVHRPTSRVRWGALAATSVESMLMMATFVTMHVAVSDPHMFVVDIGWVLSVPVLVLSVLLLFLAILVSARKPIHPSVHELHELEKGNPGRGGRGRARVPKFILLMERVLSAGQAVTIVATVLAGFIVGWNVHVRDIAAREEWSSYDAPVMDAPVLSGLLIALAVFALVHWWRYTFNLLAVRFIAAHFPVLGVVVVLLAVITALVASIGLAFPTGCALIIGIVVAAAAARLFIAAISSTVLNPALRTYFGKDDNPVGSRYQNWIRQHEELARTRVERLTP